MRFVIQTALAVLALVFAGSTKADELQFSKVVKASLVFRDDFDAARSFPHLLKVYVRLENVHDSDVFWIANSKSGIEAELLDAAGKPVPQGPQAASIPSNPSAYALPFGSRLDWLISHGGISLMGDAKDKYALIVGNRGWLVPIESAGTYSLRIRLRGQPWKQTVDRAELREPELLLDLPPTQLAITK